ncbi:MAG: hypothetical protein LBM18_04925 [Oscillospiraceae bacterium]|jgi:hypothetical protein|nr:hypothetical protein [Oscillospiraceae bacterium]
MAIKPKDIYKSRKKSHTAAKVTVLAIFLVIALVITAFFVVRSWAVYDSETGTATIVWPWTPE